MNKNKPYCDALLFKMLSLNSSETKYLVSVLIVFLQVRKSENKRQIHLKSYVKIDIY